MKNTLPPTIPKKSSFLWFQRFNQMPYLVKVYGEAINRFWPTDPDRKRWIDCLLIHRILVQPKLHNYFKRNSKHWYHPFVLKVFKVYPYFWSCYSLKELDREKERVKGVWDKTPKSTIVISPKIHLGGIFEPILKAIRAELNTAVDLVYDSKKLKPLSTLDFS